MIHGKNDFAEDSKILLDTDLKIIALAEVIFFAISYLQIFKMLLASM